MFYFCNITTLCGNLLFHITTTSINLFTEANFYYHVTYAPKSNAKSFQIHILNIKGKWTIAIVVIIKVRIIPIGSYYYDYNLYYFNYNYYIDYDHYSNYNYVTKVLWKVLLLHYTKYHKKPLSPKSHTTSFKHGCINNPFDQSMNVTL